MLPFTAAALAAIVAAASTPLAVAAPVAAPSAVAFAGAGDAFELAHPAVRVFSDRDGLPQNTVHAIARDASGYLWVGTQDGAARFNGRSWTVVEMPDREVSNYIRALLCARDGSVWFGRENGGIVRLQDGAFTVFGRDSGLPAERVNALVETRDGAIWAATHGGGAARLSGSRFVTVSEGLSDLRLWTVQEIEDASGARLLVVGGEGGVAVLSGTRFSAVEIEGGVASVNAIVQPVGNGPRPVWLGTYGSGVIRTEPWSAGRAGAATRFGPAEGLASRLVTRLAFTAPRAGRHLLWASTRDQGLFRLDGDRFVPVALGGSTTEVYTVRQAEDDPGALWVGTRTSGLLRLEPASWLTLDHMSGLPADQVLGFLETHDADGTPVFWVGTAEGLAVIRGRRLSVEGAAEGLPGPQVLALAELREPGAEPQIWASVVGYGLVRRVGRRWQRVDARPAFNADHGAWLLATHAADGAAVLWVATERSGLARMSRGRWSVITTADGLPSNHVVSLLETGPPLRRRLWVGTRGGGVAEIVDGRVAATWNRGSGLPNDDVLALAQVTLPGGRREVWAGTRSGVVRRGLQPGDGWARLDAGPAVPALPRSTVLSIGQDRAGRIYVGTQRGVVRLTPRATKGGALEFDGQVFGVADGLPSASANWGQLHDSRGRVWLSTTRGVALLDPAREAADTPPPAPLALEVAVAGTGRAIAPGASLSPDEHDVRFEYALLTPRGAGAVRYRSQLVGYDAAPSAWTDDPRKSYTNLPAGSYVLRVEAREGGFAAAPVQLAFSVRAKPWLRPWALALEALALALIGALLLRFRERRLRARAEALEALVAERTRQLSEANARLSELSITDPLTGLPNRRRLEAHADEEWRRLARHGEQLAFAMIDVDHFKAYNDSQGHLAGDECLRRIAGALTQLAKRPGDLLVRYGGEEFACLLTGIDRDQAAAHGERLRAAVECLDLPHPTSPVVPRVTISVGLAWTRPQPGGDWREALARADAALYRAKAAGRNRVEITG